MTFLEASRQCRFGHRPRTCVSLNTYAGAENAEMRGELIYWWTEGLVIETEDGDIRAIPNTTIQEVEVDWIGSEKDDMGFGNYDFDGSGVEMTFSKVCYRSCVKRIGVDDWSATCDKL